MTDTEQLRKVFVQNAVGSYRKSDKNRWICSLWCSRVVGKYDRGATLGLASDMGVSVDTIEDMAHAYAMFEKMCKYNDGMFRRFVFNARALPYIYHSHFRAIYDAVHKYGLSDAQSLDLLMDVVQNEGTISSRDVDGHARGRFGKETDWTYDAQQLQKKINKFLSRPDVPLDGRRLAAELYNWIGDQT